MAFVRKLAVLFVFAIGAFAPAAQAGPFISMYFVPQTIDVGGTSRLQINIYEYYFTPVTGGQIAGFNYPADLVNAATPNVASTCPASFTADPGAGSLSATGINIIAGGVCTIEVDVTSSVAAVYTMTFPAGAFNGSTGPNSTDSTTQLAVTPPLIVTTTADSGPGSLRQAITDANDFCTTPYGGYPRIRFNIGEVPPLVIPLDSALPSINCGGTEIDATTQPGWQANTAVDGTNNAVIAVQLTRGSCPAVECGDGLYFATYGSVKGLAIYGFPSSAITATSGATIQGSYLGVKPDSLSMLGGAYGVRSTGSGYADIGGPAAGDANLISGNDIGVQIETSYAYIEGNLIGGDANGGSELGNRLKGVLLTAASYRTRIGRNFIRHNGAAGIGVENGSIRNEFSMNASFANGGPGIDLGNDGPTPNDGPAYPFNYPVITSVRHVGADTLIEGYLKSSGGQADIEFFHNSVMPPAGITEGEKLIGGTTVIFDDTGIGAFSVPIFGFLAENVSASAVIDTCGDGCVGSSEYSPAVAVGAAPPDSVVTNENDTGPGSLANAIAFVNANCATSKIVTFNIPGPGVHQIQPLTPLPDLACSDMVIDGFSQPGASANTLDVGNNATLLVEIDGTDISASGGFRIAAPAVVIKGLSIHQFHDSAAITVTAPIGTTGGQVLGNFIGINALGALRNNLHGVANNPGATGLSIGGASPWERNVISGNSGYGIYLQSGDSTYIDNNYIGLNPAGTAAIGNSGGGIRLAGTTNTQVTFNVVSGNATGASTAGIRDEGSYSYYAGNYVGTDATGAASIANDIGVQFLNSTNAIFGTGEGGNLVSGNSTIGVKVDSSTNMSLRGNYIGTDATGWAAVPNSGAGVEISASSGVEVGGPPGNGNKITNNGTFGVNVASGQGNPILANSIFLNGVKDIALEGMRPGNDACDVDTGANDLQNFPLLDSAVTGEGGTLMAGTVTGRANTTLRIEFFSQPSGTVYSGHVRSGRVRSGPVYQDFIGSTNVDTGPGCSAPLNVTVGSGVPVGYTITATATDPSNNTSAFSLPVTATGPSVPLSCNIFHTDLATGDAANTVTGDRIVTAGGALQLFVSCSDFTNATYAWSTGETTGYIAVTGPAAGATATYSITVTTDTGTATATKNFIGALAGTPSCTLTPSGSNPIPPGFIGPFNVDASCSPGATSFSWLNSGPEVIGGQETATATYQFAFTPSPGYGYTVQMTPSNASGQGPDATRLIWIQPFIVSPDGLGFPDTVAGTQSAPQAITIRNVSDYYLTYGSFVVTGPFTAVSHCPAPITAGTTCTVDVRFAPTGVGVEQVGYLTFSSGFPGNSDISVLLSGNGLPNVPHVTVTPRSLVFPARTVLTTSSPQTVTFTNPGPASVAFGGAIITGDFAFTTSCGAVVPAEGGCTFQVTFTPLDVGSRTGTFTINSDAASSPDVISLAGSGLAPPVPAVALIPGTLDFAPQILGSTSAMQFATVSNDGSAPLVFGPITVGGDYVISLDFISARGPCVTDLAPGASCEIGVAFHPTAAGLREGAITINTNAPDPVATVRLVGTGLVTAPPRMLSVPASLAFDPQRVGTTSAGRSVRITNNFATAATITELSVTGDFSVSDTCTTIPARGSCSPLVTFQPSAVGDRLGTLTIRALSEISPYVVQLRGLGEVNPLPALAASISQAGFGNAFVGSAAQVTFELRNIGQVPVVIDSIAPLGDFLASHACTTIPALGTCPVTIYFVPNGVGRRAGSLLVRSNAEGSPLRIELSGTGCAIPSIARSRFGGLLCGAP